MTTPPFDAVRAALLAVGAALTDFETVYRDAIAAPASQLPLRAKLSGYFTEPPAPLRRLDRELIAALRALAAWHSLDGGRLTPLAGGGAPASSARVPRRRHGDRTGGDGKGAGDGGR